MLLIATNESYGRVFRSKKARGKAQKKMEGCCSEVNRRIAADTEVEGGIKKKKLLKQENGGGRGPKGAYDNYNSNKCLRGSKYFSELIVPYGCQFALHQDERHSVTHFTTTG